MSERAAAAERVLAAAGIDPASLAADPIPEGTVSRIRSLLEGPDGAAVAEALGEFAAPAVAGLLVALEPHAARAAHKAVRRALYRLSQRGIAIPAAPTPPPRLALAPDLDALLSAFDRDGDRFLWLARHLPQGGALLVYAHIHEPQGLRQLSVAEVGRKRLRELRRQLTSGHGPRFVPIDWRIADALLVEAQQRLATPDSRCDYLRVRPRLTSEPPAPAAEPVSTRIPRNDDSGRAAPVADSAALLDLPEIQSWLPDDATVQPFSDEIDAIRSSPLVLSQAAQEERIRAILRRAAGLLVPPLVLARRLEGTAYVLAETGRAPAAAQALAVAATLRAEPAAAADVPIVLRLTERAVGRLLATETARHEAAERDALVVTPAQLRREQAARDRSSSHPGRTRG